MNPTRIDLTPDHRAKICSLLNERLADIIDLTQQARQAHWNVKGPNFIGLHHLFDEVYGNLAEHTDEIAERIVALGGNAEGRVQQVAKASSLPCYPDGIHGGRAHVDALASALAVFGKGLIRLQNCETRTVPTSSPEFHEILINTYGSSKRICRTIECSLLSRGKCLEEI